MTAGPTPRGLWQKKKTRPMGRRPGLPFAEARGEDFGTTGAFPGLARSSDGASSPSRTGRAPAFVMPSRKLNPTINPKFGSWL